jgi:hypothetical protein
MSMTNFSSEFLVTLEGGPPDLPQVWSVHPDAATDTKIKIRRGNGYEHFERLHAELADDSGAPPVFTWTMRTQIAE